jgi:hypothetical protein
VRVERTRERDHRIDSCVIEPYSTNEERKTLEILAKIARFQATEARHNFLQFSAV